jgi:hypothetical protein
LTSSDESLENLLSEVKSPNSGGSKPERKFLESVILTRSTKSPICGGRKPENILSAMLRFPEVKCET